MDGLIFVQDSVESNGSHLSSPHAGSGGYNAASDHREGKPDEEWHALDTLEKAKVSEYVLLSTRNPLEG